MKTAQRGNPKKQKIYKSCNRLRQFFLLFNLLLRLRLPIDTQDAQDNAEEASKCGDEVRVPVTIPTEIAGQGRIGRFGTREVDYRVGVIHPTINKVECAADDDGTKDHDTPVLAESGDTEEVGDDGGEDTKNGAVAETGERGDVFD